MTIDEKEKAKQWLNRAYKIDLQIASKVEQIALWRSLANKTTTNYTPSESSCSGTNNRMETYCIKICDAEIELENDKEKLINTKQEIKAAIDKVTDISQKLLLEERYLLYKNWYQIARALNYSYDYTRGRLHNKALLSVL